MKPNQTQPTRRPPAPLAVGDTVINPLNGRPATITRVQWIPGDAFSFSRWQAWIPGFCQNAENFRKAQPETPAPPSHEPEKGPCSALPESAGFYWWREGDTRPWRMVKIDDLAAGHPDEPPHLAAYDVEHGHFGGRTLAQWAQHEPTGQWIPLHKPSAHGD